MSKWSPEQKRQSIHTSHFELQTSIASSLQSSASSLLIPIEQVPLGARIPTKNPRPWEYDDSLPEPDQTTWAKLSLSIHRKDGGIVDVEMLRPRSWIARYELQVGQLVPMNLPELEVHGAALITDIGNCPEIAEGEGSVVTARYLTREVHAIARVTVARPSRSWIEAVQAEWREPSDIDLTDLVDLSTKELAHLEALGLIELEVLEGTPIHPIWSEDLQSWVPLSELEIGETLRSADGPAVVLSVTIASTSQPVYNIEVHGEHVYQVGEFGLLAHNECHHIVSHFANAGRGFVRPWTIDAQRILRNAGIGIRSKLNKVDLPWHRGMHPEFYHQRVFERLDSAVSGLNVGSAMYRQKVASELQTIANILMNNPSGLTGVGL